MTIQNGSGLKNLVPDSEKSDRTLSWETSVDPSFHVWKRFYLRDEDDPQLDYITEYFSKPVYLTLFHSFRTLLHTDCDTPRFSTISMSPSKHFRLHPSSHLGPGPSAKSSSPSDH